MESKANQDVPVAYTACWALWANPSRNVLPLPRVVDQALSGYLFYPEPEWARHGYRPPENYPLLGAWRDVTGKVFAFLLEPDPEAGGAREKRLLLYVAGDRNAVDELGARVTAIKSVLAKSERKELQVRQAEYRLGQEQKYASLPRLVKLIGVFTAIVNAFSMYLRRLPPPDLPSATLQLIYKFLVAAIHVSSLTLLLAVTMVGVAYVVQYGVLLLRRL